MATITQNADTLAGDLVSLFLTAAKATTQRLQACQWPFTLPVVQTIIKRDRRNSGDAWKTDTSEVQQNILASEGVGLYRIAPLLSDTVIVSLQCCATELVNDAQSKLPFWSVFEGKGWMLIRGASDPPLPSTDYKGDAGDWTMRRVVLPALFKHLADLPSVAAATVDDAERFAADVLQVARDDQLLYRATVPLAGLDFKGPQNAILQSGNVTIRRLSPSERGTLVSDWGITTPGAGQFTTLPLVALQMDISAPRDRQNPDAGEHIAPWLCVLQLLGYSISGYNAWVEALPEWAMPTRSGVPLTLPQRCSKFSVL